MEKQHSAVVIWMKTGLLWKPWDGGGRGVMCLGKCKILGELAAE